MTINEIFNIEKEIDRLENLIKDLRETKRDGLKLKYFEAELRFYRELNNKGHRQCVYNAREAEIARMEIEMDDWGKGLLSSCPRERSLAQERIEAIEAGIKCIREMK